jgi:hypothetical protein
MSDELLTTKQLADRLQVSTDHLLHLCKDGTLKPKKHFIDIRKKVSKKPCYRFKLKPCLDLFALPPNDRS